MKPTSNTYKPNMYIYGTHHTYNEYTSCIVNVNIYNLSHTI